MTQDEIIEMARQAGFNVEQGFLLRVTGIDEDLERFAALVAAAEREKVAKWQMGSGYSTGHGETIEDLLVELEWQVRESEREACAKVCLTEWSTLGQMEAGEAFARAIRARGNT
jgi:hypothetical protein